VFTLETVAIEIFCLAAGDYRIARPFENQRFHFMDVLFRRPQTHRLSLICANTFGFGAQANLAVTAAIGECGDVPADEAAVAVLTAPSPPQQRARHAII
jgi:hypothetical protein